MPHARRLTVLCVAILSFSSAGFAQAPAEKPAPDARFENWLFKKPDPHVWHQSEENGNLVFALPRPPGDFCTLTLFAGQKAAPDFAAQFDQAVSRDQTAKGTVKIEADSGAKPSKAAEGFDVLTRSLRSETATLHALHLYIAGHSGDRFDLAAFQTSSEESWKKFGADAAQFMQSLKLANSLAPADLQKMLARIEPAAPPPPTLPGFDDAPAFGGPAKAIEPAPAAENTSATAPAAEPAQPGERVVPEIPLSHSPLVVKDAVIQKNGKPIDGIKLSQHDREITSPSIAVSRNGAIHIAFNEIHRTTYAPSIYHRSSSDGGKTWSEAKNLSEEMPDIKVGQCTCLVDGQDRVYVIWRTGLGVNFPAASDPGAAGQGNLVYRVLQNGKWSKIKNIHPPGSAQKQDDGALAYFAVVDAAGRAQVVWNALPDHWHPEVTKISGEYHQHLAGIGNGLVFQSTLDGANPAAPQEIYLPPVGGQGEQGGYGLYCDGLNSLNGFVDAAGHAHFVAQVTSYHDESYKHQSRFELIENAQAGPHVDLPDLSYHGWRDIPTLLVDASGTKHLVLLYPAGERPSIRDYLLGSDEEPTIIRQAASVKGTVDGFQAYQGPNGRMVAIMQMNDSGERGSGETYISMSNGKGWSTPINVTNNEGRKSFVSKQTSVASNIAIAKSYYPGRAAAAIDNEGHLLVLMINNEYGLFSNSAFGVTLAGGSSSTPTLQFLKF